MYCSRHIAVTMVASLMLWANFAVADDPIKPAELPAARLPVKRVVMFSSGVAFYEHNGQVNGNVNVEMQFNVRDINDLLKSMVLQDSGGGKVSAVSYGSKEPVTRALQTFSIDLTSNPTLADLLGQIRGEKIEIDAPAKLTGTVIGVEQRRVPSGKDEVVEVPYLNLLTDDGLRSVSLENAGRIKILNAKLDAELKQALAVLATAKSTDKKAVSLSFLGEGERPVRVGYIQESPIWKTSYRLVLADEDKPFLQGWAIVENTTEADWENVGLTLISGRPISFVMDLYQPLYVNRPIVVPELFASLRPRTYDQDLAKADEDFNRAGDEADEKAADKSGGRRSLAMGRMPASGMGGMSMAPGGMANGKRAELSRAAAAPQPWNLQQGAQSVATATDVGELFRYEISTPVTLARSKSAMLPIVNESVEGEKVAIYNESTHPKHPLNGLRLKNTTDLHLMQGPITVFDDEVYAGDAQIQDLEPKSERLISYAMALDTEVAVSDRRESNHLVSVRLQKGTAIVSTKNERSRMYTLKNSGKKAKKVLVEYPVEPNWHLVEPQEASEKTRALYRFAIDAQPGKPATLTVREEYTASQAIVLTNLDDNMIAIYLKAKEVSDEVKQALQTLVKRKAEIQSVVAKRQELERQIQVVEAEQKRIRENMPQLAKDSDLFRRYEAKFTKQEDEIDTLRHEVTTGVAEEQKLRQALDAYLAGLDIK